MLDGFGVSSLTDGKREPCALSVLACREDDDLAELAFIDWFIETNEISMVALANAFVPQVVSLLICGLDADDSPAQVYRNHQMLTWIVVAIDPAIHMGIRDKINHSFNPHS
jgi:hypothetical protein